jgi:hypothetical protein
MMLLQLSYLCSIIQYVANGSAEAVYKLAQYIYGVMRLEYHSTALQCSIKADDVAKGVKSYS